MTTLHERFLHTVIEAGREAGRRLGRGQPTRYHTIGATGYTIWDAS
jgi:hypothetical protein